MGVTALVFGILSVILCWIPVVNWFSLILSVVGIVLGAVGMSKAKKNDGQGKGVATAGLVLCIIATALAGIVVLACGACAAAGAL